MKLKIITFSLLICSVFFAQAQLNKVAIISVFGDKNLSDDPMNTLIYEKILNDTSYNITRVVNDFDITLREKFVTQFPFPFMAKEDVVGAEGYGDLEELSRYKEGNWYVVPGTDYISIAAWGSVFKDEEAIKKSFELLPDDVDGVMIAYLNFNMYAAGGIGPLAKNKIYAYVNVKIFNKEGKRIFKLKERESSDSGVLAVGGVVTNPSEVMPMIDEASVNLFEAMDKKLGKSLGKLLKKMEKEMK